MYFTSSNFILYKSVLNDLTHLSLVYHKRDSGKKYRPWSDAAERGVWLGSTLFAFTSAISTKHDNNNNNNNKTTIHPWYWKWACPKS